MRYTTTVALALALTLPAIAHAYKKYGIDSAGSWVSPPQVASPGAGDSGSRVDAVDLDTVRSIRGRATAGISMNAIVFLTALAGIATSPLELDVFMTIPALTLYSVSAPFAWSARARALHAQGLPGADGHVKASIAGYVSMMASGTIVSTPLGLEAPPMRTVFWANLSGNAMASLIMCATAIRQSRKIAEERTVASSLVPFATGTAGNLVVGVTGTF